MILYFILICSLSTNLLKLLVEYKAVIKENIVGNLIYNENGLSKFLQLIDV